MTPHANRQVRLKTRPSAIPEASHFEIVTAPVPELRPGQLLVRNLYLSVDPAMRGWVSAVANYAKPVGIGEVMRSRAAGEVVASRHPDHREGERLVGWFGWQDYAVTDGSGIIRRVDETDIPLSAALGILGMNGLTAYFGLLDIGTPKPGETVVVSTAAGAVGSAVGQIAKIKGCRTVGIAGGAVKARLCREEFAYDAAIDYKATRDHAGLLDHRFCTPVRTGRDRARRMDPRGQAEVPRGYSGGHRECPPGLLRSSTRSAVIVHPSRRSADTIPSHTSHLRKVL